MMKKVFFQYWYSFSKGFLPALIFAFIFNTALSNALFGPSSLYGDLLPAVGGGGLILIAGSVIMIVIDLIRAARGRGRLWAGTKMTGGAFLGGTALFLGSFAGLYYGIRYVLYPILTFSFTAILVGAAIVVVLLFIMFSYVRW